MGQSRFFGYWNSDKSWSQVVVMACFSCLWNILLAHGEVGLQSLLVCTNCCQPLACSTKKKGHDNHSNEGLLWGGDGHGHVLV